MEDEKKRKIYDGQKSRSSFGYIIIITTVTVEYVDAD